MKIFEKHIPRWVILIIDLMICSFSLLLAHQLRFNFVVPAAEYERLPLMIAALLMVRASTFVIFRTYANIVRYTSTRDAMRIILTIGLGSAILGLLNLVFEHFTAIYLIPFSVIIIDYFITVFLMTASRLLVKVLYMEMKNPTSAKTNVIIYGAGESGVITKRSLDRDAGTKYRVIAFIDDNEKKVRQKLEGVTIYSAKRDLDSLIAQKNIAFFIISIQNISSQRKKELVEYCLSHSIKVLNVPPVDNWINGQLSFKQIKKIKIEDLLERDPINLDKQKISEEVSGRVILVTGAAGSIGSEIVRQITAFKPGKLIILDQAESPLYDIELEVAEKHKVENLVTVIADIRDREKMRQVFSTHRPHFVFHAAAYKHVPMMELNPAEAVLTNIGGTVVLADLAMQHGTSKFVMVSTDKAVNPTNVMGASKRIAEIYCQALSSTGKVKFITTRFGNVLGSNGSVIPRFRRQIEEGGPVTVTHPDITRYFMTIPEACQLVLEAGAMGNGGEICIFDMGESVRVADLARKMIKLSGLTLDKDITMIYTGLRPGEKLFEELLNEKENTRPTHHEKIMIAKVREYAIEQVADDVRELLAMAGSTDDMLLVKKMKEIVPEFVSRNSRFESLDKNQPTVER